MVSPTLTTEEGQILYEQRHAVRDVAALTITTHTAIYEWSEQLQVYVVMHEHLRVQHRAGAAWSHHDRCFVPCRCRWCEEHPAKVACTDVYCP